MTDDNNLFDEDDALDYILYEEVNKETSDGGKGCLGMIILLILPLAGFGYLFFNNSS
jgi:hypothetical protein